MNSSIRQWITGKNANGTVNREANNWRRVVLFILGLALCVGALVGAPTTLQLFLSGLAVGVALKSALSRW